MSEHGARGSIALAGVSIAVIVTSLTTALVAPSSVATGVTLVAMSALALSLHAIGRAHPGP